MGKRNILEMKWMGKNRVKGDAVLQSNYLRVPIEEHFSVVCDL